MSTRIRPERNFVPEPEPRVQFGIGTGTGTRLCHRDRHQVLLPVPEPWREPVKWENDLNVRTSPPLTSK